LTIIQVRIDGGSWMNGLGLGNWNLSINTASLAEGRHEIEARAFDGTLYSNTTSVEITVYRPESRVTLEPFPFYIPVILIAAAIGLGVFYESRRRSKG
jgi:hypothetical protein